MSKTTLFLGILVGLPLSAQADPRAMMMMQGAWMQSRQQPRQVSTPGPLQLATSRSKAPRMKIPAVKPKAVKPKAVKPKAVKPKTVKPKTVKPKAVKPEPAVADKATQTPAPPRVADQGASAATGSTQGFFSHAMYRLGRVIGAGLRRERAVVARIKWGGKPARERHLIPYGSLPVGLLLTPYRQHTLNIGLNPAVLVNMRRARLLTNTEFDLLMQHVALQAPPQ